MAQKLSIDEVLNYQLGRRSQQTVKRYFVEWRKIQKPPIPLRCDNEECYFHTNPLVWNSQPFNLILDHKNGVSGDNRPKNLQFLCPNCNAQQPTHGGGNKGKVKQSGGGFAKEKDGKWHYTLPALSGKFRLN
jgi:hypothetical protein